MDPKRPLSEISHLFLSEIRARQPDATRPVRIAPPKKADHSIDMTPEEFEASLQSPAFSAEGAGEAPSTENPSTVAKSSRISVVLSSHLAERSGQGVRQYARHLASQTGHAALIEADGGEFAVTCFERDGGPATTPTALDNLDSRQISETLNELAFDVDRWLISLANAKTPEAREVLKAAPHWVLLTTADHEGVVATYRALKGLSELGRRRISLVVLDARDDAHAEAIFRKLDAVSRQFLHSGLEAGMPLRAVENVAEHAVLICRQNQDQSKPGGTEHWNVITQFLAGAIAPKTQNPTEQPQPMKPNIPEITPSETPKFPMANESVPEVIDLPAEASDRSILDAVVRQGGADGRWVLCPINAPMCPEALLAVARDQRLMLLAVAGRGLGQMLSIGQALRWVSENTALIRMALPQLSIDATAVPCIRLLVDHNDLSAEILQPMLQTGTVTVQAYRRIKWGTKMGLLLEAA